MTPESRTSPDQPAEADQPEAEYVERTGDEWQDPAEPNTFPSGNTLGADRADAQVHGHADREPTADEEAAAPSGPVSDEVADSYKEAMERGANIKGEGQI